MWIRLILFTSLFLLIVSAYQFYPAARVVYQQVQIFGAVLERIQEDYVEEKNTGKLMEVAIHGMLETLDPHTTFMNAENFKNWNQSFEGYSGIGIYFDIIQDKITILSVIPGGPSEAVGLQSGDRVVAIDGVSVVGLKRDEVPLKLMGPKGTKVAIAVERSGWDRNHEFEIIRDEVHLTSVPYAFLLQDGTGYIYISRFSSSTASEFENALDKLEAQGMRRLLLDLRQNGGGYLDAAVAVSDQFLPGGRRIVYTDGRVKSAFREFFATDSRERPVPLILMIDRTSASASEIVAGALQDWDRALIVGETSFGKGLVQSQYRFQDGSALLMTTARYHTPTGRVIQRPYNGKKAEDYYEEIWIDSLRALKPDRSAPTFQTLILKRTVYGGGGIRPDQFLSAKNDTLSPIVRDLAYSPQRLFFSFTERYIEKNPELKKDYNLFLREYQPKAEVMQQFLQYIRREGFSISDTDFSNNRKQLSFLLKQNIATAIWGDEAGYKVQMLRDRQLLEALKYFPQAEKMLSLTRSNR